MICTLQVRVAQRAQLQREAELVAGTPPGPDVLQVFVAQRVVAQQVRRWTFCATPCGRPAWTTSTTTSPPAFATTGRDSTTACGSCATATCSSSGSSTALAATSPTLSTPCRTCRSAGWASGCSPARGRRSTPPPPRPAASCSASSRRREFEWELIRERTRAGLKAARARGRKGGRKFALSKGPGAAGPSRDGPPRYVGVRAVPRTRYQAGDALQVRRTAGAVARAGPEGPGFLNWSA